MAEDPLSRYRVPVSPDAPAGDDLTYDDAYLRVREEIDRAGTVSVAVDHEKAIDGGGGSAGQGVDYTALAESVRELLAGRTRDLQLAAYLTFALARDRGADGLAEGLEVTWTLLDAFGQTVHPLKPLRRRNALQYLADRVREWMTDRSFTAADAEALERARAAAAAVHEWTTQQMGDQAPALSGLLQSLDEALRLSQRTEKAVGTGAAATNGAIAAAPVAAPAPTGVASPSDARRAVFQAAAFLREQDASSPLSYRLARAMAWGGLTTAPPSQAGRTIIEAPDAGMRARVEQLTDPAARLRAVEEAFVTRPLWLDLQRIAAEAAEQAGGAMALVRATVVEETVSFVQRVPDLPSLAFADGTPLADAATLAWIDSLSREAGGAGTSPPGVGDGIDEALDAARARAAAGDTREAVRILRDAPGSLAGRARFTRGLHIARLCQQAGRLDVATALLDGLVDEATRRDLAGWEPDLALDCLRLAHAAWSSTEAAAPAAERDTARARARAIYAILCRVDPGAALTIAGAADKKGGRG